MVLGNGMQVNHFTPGTGTNAVCTYPDMGPVIVPWLFEDYSHSSELQVGFRNSRAAVAAISRVRQMATAGRWAIPSLSATIPIV